MWIYFKYCVFLFYVVISLWYYGRYIGTLSQFINNIVRFIYNSQLVYYEYKKQFKINTIYFILIFTIRVAKILINIIHIILNNYIINIPIIQMS